MKLKIELTDRYGVASTAEQYIDLANEDSVQDAFVTFMRLLERGGWDMPEELKDEVGNGWATNSAARAGGNKQVDLKNGAMHIATSGGSMPGIAGDGLSIPT